MILLFSEDRGFLHVRDKICIIIQDVLLFIDVMVLFSTNPRLLADSAGDPRISSSSIHLVWQEKIGLSTRSLRQFLTITKHFMQLEEGFLLISVLDIFFLGCVLNFLDYRLNSRWRLLGLHLVLAIILGGNSIAFLINRCLLERGLTENDLRRNEIFITLVIKAIAII